MPHVHVGLAESPGPPQGLAPSTYSAQRDTTFFFSIQGCERRRENINNAARNMRVAHSFMTGLNECPTLGPSPLREGLLSRPARGYSLTPSPGPPGLAPQHLTDQRTAPDRTCFLLNNKAVKTRLNEGHVTDMCEIGGDLH